MVILATKIYVSGDARRRALTSLESLVDNDLGTLDISTEYGIRHDDFAVVTIDGPDAAAARNFLRDRWGEIPTHFIDGETYVGTLESWDAEGFVLDAGEPLRVPAESLELGPGSPPQLRRRFGLVQHMPLRFVYDGETDTAQLAPVEVDRLFEWHRGVGRINVNSTTRSELRATINRAGHAQDITTIERLGVLEQSVLCTEGTDPPGLLSAIGPYLSAELLCVIP